MSLAKLKLLQLAQHGELFSRYGASIRVLGQRSLVKPDVLEAIDRAVELTKDNSKTILNVCFPYTSRDEITTAIRNVVKDYSTPVRVTSEKERPFSELHIAHHIRTTQLSAATSDIRAHSPSSGAASDVEDSNISTSSTLQSFTCLEGLRSSGDFEERPSKGLVFPDPEKISAATLNNSMFTAGMPPLDLLVRTSGVERLSDFMLWQVHEGTEIAFLNCMWPEFDLWTFLPVLVEWQWKRRKEGEGGKVGRGGARQDERTLLDVQ